jgi:glycosyltransferase involved in cell wall biosynthesis
VTVTVLTGQPNYPEGSIFPGYRAVAFGHEQFDGIDVFRVPLVPRGARSAARLALNYLSFVASASVVAPWLLRGREFDVILVYAPSPITQAIPAVLLGRLKGASVVTWVQDLWPESLEATGFVRSPAILSVADAVVRWIYRRNALLLGQSRAFVRAIQAKVPEVAVRYFPNPGEGVGPATESVPVLTLPHGFNVVFAGNLGTVQSLPTILDAAERLLDDPDVRFVLVGSGSLSDWLAEEVARRSLTNVVLAGRFPVTAVPAILHQASVLLVSLTKSEILSKTIPAKVQSYLAAGRPIVASMDGEGADLVRESGAGLSAPAEDGIALAECVRQMKRLSPEERARMGAAGRRYYDDHFRPEVLAEHLVHRFRALRSPAIHQESP